MSGYEYSRKWFEFSFDNQAIVNTNHTAMYLWFVELNNRMGWAKEFASPASQTMAAIGVKSYKTYKTTYDDLIKFGFIKEVKPSKNQYQSCIIALVIFTNTSSNTLTKSLLNHSPFHSESIDQDKDSIIKQETIKQINHKQESKFNFKKSLIDLGIKENLVKDWLIVRKNKKLSNTETAFNSIKNEIEKTRLSFEEIITICVENSWGGFKENWLNNLKNNNGTNNKGASKQLKSDAERQSTDFGDLDDPFRGMRNLV